MKPKICIIVFMLAVACAGRSADVNRQLLRLDSCIQQKSLYDGQKEQRLARLKSELRSASDAASRYRVSYALFDEYKSYNFDSAYHYTIMASDQAKAIGNRNYMVEAGCAVVFCYLSAGLYKEAFDAMTQTSPTGADDEHLKQYYMMWTRLYYDMANYNNSPPYEQRYVELGNRYADTLMHYIPERSVYWYYVLAQRQMKSHDFAASTETFQKMMALPDVDSRLLAIAYSCMGWNHWIEGREEEAIANLVESAVCDIQSSVKENTSTCSLANILYRRGDNKRAVSYAQSALEDANFYGARHRKIQVGEILPIIEQDRYQLMAHQRNLYVLAIAIAVLFIVVLLVATGIIRKQVKKLDKAKQTIDERNRVLEQTNQQLLDAQHTISRHNEALQQANERLEEADRIKTVYIGKSFYLNSEYIGKVEKLYKTVDRKLVARQYDDLRAQLKDSTLAAERKNMFADFDETFLKLFPDFVNKFNQLFDEKDRRWPDGEQSLTSEMRIFALIRLGISDSERIANFLDYSVHTVNTYKTRIKNRSLVDNEQFEQHIMAI